MKRPMTTMKTTRKQVVKPVPGPSVRPNKDVAETFSEAVESPKNKEISSAKVNTAPKDTENPAPVRVWDNARNLRGVSAKDGTTKAKIERAALHLFAEHGVDGVSTKQIAKAAGISEGAIYRHFSGKEELARSMMRAIHDRLTDMIATADEAHETLEEKIQFIVRHYCRIADEDWDLFQYHILHLHHFPRLADSPEASPMGAAANILQKAMDDDQIEPMDPLILAAMALGVVLQTAQAKVFGYVEGPLAARTDLFTRRVLAVLSARQKEG